MNSMNTTALAPVHRPIQRMTVCSMVHHERSGERPQSLETSFSSTLTSDEESYTRKCKANEEWVPLNFGFVPIDQVGMFVIENVEGRNFHVNPSEQELDQIRLRVIEVAVVGAEDVPFVIPTKQHHPFNTPRPDRLRIRCRPGGGQAQYRIFVVPR